MRNRTDIMVTIPDTRCTADFVQRLQNAGATSVRINSAHVTSETLTEMIRIINSSSPEMKILMDTKGPEIRTTNLDGTKEKIELKEGDKIIIEYNKPCDNKSIGINVCPNVLNLKATDKILLDDGEIELTVLEVCDSRLQGQVIRGGWLGSRKTVDIPNADISSLPAVSHKDKKNIAAAIKAGIDMIAHSFVRNADDVKAVRTLIKNSPIKLYSKIECRSALDNITEILEESDGLLIGRGDLGSQIDFTEIPEIQNKISTLCYNANKPIIVATQLMHSMIENPIPTRAEISDISTAVRDRIGTLLLTGETAYGKYPIECVEIMKRTITRAEEYFLKDD